MNDTTKLQLPTSIKQIDLAQVPEATFKYRFVGCIVLTHDHKILLQQIIDARKFFPAGSITTFGGRIESGENPLQALIREMHEELGARVAESEVVKLGIITEAATNQTELIHTYFWHDKNNTITGCYEDSAKYFDNADEVIAYPNVTDEVVWMLGECKKRSLLQ